MSIICGKHKEVEDMKFYSSHYWGCERNEVCTRMGLNIGLLELNTPFSTPIPLKNQNSSIYLRTSFMSTRIQINRCCFRTIYNFDKKKNIL